MWYFVLPEKRGGCNGKCCDRENRDSKSETSSTHTFVSDAITFDAEANIVNLQMYNL